MTNTPKLDPILTQRTIRALKEHADLLRDKFADFCQLPEGTEVWEILGDIQTIRRCYERFQHESLLLECCDNDDNVTYRELNDNRLKRLGISD